MYEGDETACLLKECVWCIIWCTFLSTFAGGGILWASFSDCIVPAGVVCNVVGGVVGADCTRARDGSHV